MPENLVVRISIDSEEFVAACKHAGRRNMGICEYLVEAVKKFNHERLLHENLDALHRPPFGVDAAYGQGEEDNV